MVYTLARIGLFLASWVVAAGAWTLATGTIAILGPLLVAAVVSAVASYYLLQGPRERLAAQVDARARRVADRFEDVRSREDRD